MTFSRTKAVVRVVLVGRRDGGTEVNLGRDRRERRDDLFKRCVRDTHVRHTPIEGPDP